MGRQERLRQEPEELPSRGKRGKGGRDASGWPRPHAAQARRPRPGKAPASLGGVDSDASGRPRPHATQPTTPGPEKPLPLWEEWTQTVTSMPLSGSFTAETESCLRAGARPRSLVNSGKLFTPSQLPSQRERAVLPRRVCEEETSCCVQSPRAGRPAFCSGQTSRS